jgi:hypothetical protein
MVCLVPGFSSMLFFIFYWGGGGGVFTDLLEMLLLLLERLGGLEQLVVRLVESDLELLDFLSIVADITVSLPTKKQELMGFNVKSPIINIA